MDFHVLPFKSFESQAQDGNEDDRSIIKTSYERFDFGSLRTRTPLISTSMHKDQLLRI